MISYTLLIVIAIAAGVLVFSYLKLQVPKDKPVCSDDISIVIESYQCVYSPKETNLTIVLSNKGLFTIDAAFIRIGEPKKTTKKLISDNNESDFYFLSGLKPGSGPLIKLFTIRDATIISHNGNYVLEIQPAVNDEKLGKIAVCENAIINQDISCN